MKLRNKKTGVIVEYDSIGFRKGQSNGWDDFIPNADSLAALNEVWEDYKPVEPLIKDKKVRRAVRAWAEINGIDKVRYVPYGSNEYTLIYQRIDVNLWIQFEYRIGELVEEQFYTIAELCGEEGK